ncbi:DUF2255 family protein [Isoptericola croceus]|uniref:DUF2255 family protein n=1 Tax=Isoptericola croceus TaxID=3031406 RepID=UPI0023F893D2|nr:DUF2255 family protein [Isoptericola croceus]
MPRSSLQDLATLPSAQLLTSDGSGPGAAAWVVALGRELYVRTAPGADVPRLGGGRARVRVSGVEHPVTLAEVAPEVHDLLDDAYRTKYGRCAPDKLSAVVSDVAAATTLRLSPRRPSLWERTVPLLDAVTAWGRDRPRRRGAPAAEARCVAC